MSTSGSNPKNLTPRSDADALSDDEEQADDAIITRAFFGSLAVILTLVAAAGGGILWYNRKPVETPREVIVPPVAEVRERAPVEVPKVAFTDATAAAGIQWKHYSGAYGAKLLPETMGGGCAFFDFDNDGDQDLLLINSCPWPWHDKARSDKPTCALYQNDGQGHYQDVSASVGLDITLYGMGVACGDYDNDGWVDVFVSCVGGDHLLHNEQGKFRDVTAEAGVAGGDNTWGSSSGFIDYDNDGRLDLFVCNYLTWSKEEDEKQSCRLTGREDTRAYCPPTSFDGTFPYLYHNDGNGKFSEVGEKAGLHIMNQNRAIPLAKSLGVLPIDIDEDGWIDLIVANDTVENLLFHNKRNGTFEEIGKTAGLAFDPQGNARGAMGIDAAYFRNDRRDLGVAIGNFSNQMSSMFVVQQKEPLQFADEAIATGFGPPGRLALKFGLFFFDYDLDGRQDIFTANGHIENDISLIQKSQSYAQPAHLFWNCGRGSAAEFMLTSAMQSGNDLAKPIVGRGAAYADIDNDGDLDVLVTAIDDSPRLLRNDQNLGHHFLRLKLVGDGQSCNRDAIGAWVSLEIGNQTMRQQVMPTRSYQSQVELPVTFGLGPAPKVGKVTITWPNGKHQDVTELRVDQLNVVEQTP